MIRTIRNLTARALHAIARKIDAPRWEDHCTDATRVADLDSPWQPITEATVAHTEALRSVTDALSAQLAQTWRRHDGSDGTVRY